MEFAATSERSKRAYLALIGLAVGDALGAHFETNHTDRRLESHFRVPYGPWQWTDDTEMAASIVLMLRQKGYIDPDELAQSFAQHFDPARGYGPGARLTLQRIREGALWSVAAQSLYGGTGSLGNGAAMRAAPVGAYFADDLDAVVEAAWLASQVTHAHPEGIAGGVAVAVATAAAWRLQAKRDQLSVRREFYHLLLDLLPNSAVRDGIARARKLNGVRARVAAMELGNGSQVTAADTVPYAIWCAGESLDHYPEAIWNAISSGGDLDTNAAIAGGIVVQYTGGAGVPPDWMASLEPLPAWIHEGAPV